MHIDVLARMPAEYADAAWEFYQTTFGPLRTLAVQRHVFYRDEFDALLADERMVKYLARDGDAVVGLAAQTDDLRAAPILSPDYFAHRWPQMYAERRIFYTAFVGAQPGARGTGVFVNLLRALMRPITAVDGMVVVDISTHNEVELALPSAIGLILGRIAGQATPTRLDSQSYWLYEFPAAS
jgi:hypothetical protein